MARRRGGRRRGRVVVCGERGGGGGGGGRGRAVDGGRRVRERQDGDGKGRGVAPLAGVVAPERGGEGEERVDVLSPPRHGPPWLHADGRVKREAQRVAHTPRGAWPKRGPVEEGNLLDAGHVRALGAATCELGAAKGAADRHKGAQRGEALGGGGEQLRSRAVEIIRRSIAVGVDAVLPQRDARLADGGEGGSRIEQRDHKRLRVVAAPLARVVGGERVREAQQVVDKRLVAPARAVGMVGGRGEGEGQLVADGRHTVGQDGIARNGGDDAWDGCVVTDAGGDRARRRRSGRRVAHRARAKAIAG